MRKFSCQLSGIRHQLKYYIFVICSLMLVLPGCAKQEIKNIRSKGTDIICLGDSITFGYGAEEGEDYPSLMQKFTAMPVINAGIDGDTTTEALKRLDSDVLDRDPLLVIVEFGGNDFLRKIPIEVTIKNIEYMIDKIQEKGAMVALVDISAGLFLRDYRAALARIARQKKTIFIPAILSGVITNPSLKSDFIHPNKAGYELITQRIWDAISPTLIKVSSQDKQKNNS